MQQYFKTQHKNKKTIKQVLQNPKTSLSNLYAQHGHQMANTKFLFLNKFIWMKS